MKEHGKRCKRNRKGEKKTIGNEKREGVRRVATRRCEKTRCEKRTEQNESECKKKQVNELKREVKRTENQVKERLSLIHI